MSHTEYKDLAFELKVEGDGQSKRLVGHGACFLNVDGVGDIIAPGAFKSDMGSFLADGFVGGLNHDWGQPIGRIMSASEDMKGLYFESTPIVDTAHGQDVLKLCAGPNPVIRKMSIGYKIMPGGAKFIDDPTEVKAMWETHSYVPSEQDTQRAANGVRLLQRIKVLEVSPVTIPANDRASMSLMKSSASAGFVDHSRLVASTLGETAREVADFLRRCESRMEARFKEGRELSQANWQSLKDVHDRHMDMCKEHGSMCDRMGVLLERTKPKSKGESSPEPVVPPSESKPEPIDEAAVFAAYALTMYATNPALSGA